LTAIAEVITRASGKSADDERQMPLLEEELEDKQT
jgi:hypothetical protein